MLQLYHLAFGEAAEEAARQVFFGEAGVENSVERFHGVAEVFEYAAHDAVFTGVNFDADLRFFCLR